MPDSTVLTLVFSIGIRSVVDIAGFSAFHISRSLSTDYSKPEYFVMGSGRISHARNFPCDTTMPTGTHISS